MIATSAGMGIWPTHVTEDDDEKEGSIRTGGEGRESAAARRTFTLMIDWPIIAQPAMPAR